MIKIIPNFPSVGFVLLLTFLFVTNLFWWICGIFAIFYGSVKILEWTFGIDYKLSKLEKENSKKYKFLVIGGGFSGLCVGHFFRLMGLDFKIVEKEKYSKSFSIFHISFYFLCLFFFVLNIVL